MLTLLPDMQIDFDGIAREYAVDQAVQVLARISELPALVNFGGALATSGDTYRFVIANGERLPHILDPRNGYPVRGAPRSVTVSAPTCTHAGMLTTLAMLRGPEAERFLETEAVRHWIQR